MNRLFIIPILAIFLISFKNDKPAYYLFNSKGKEVKFSSMVNDIKDADIILFGELHDNPISHWLQIELTKELFNYKKSDLILSAEMFESDNQVILDEYLNDIISRKKFESECRLWPNYRTDYKPLISLAKDSGLHFIAANVPRRYASAVYSNGFEGLDDLSNEAKAFLPPLPILYDADLNCYKSMISTEDTMAMHQNDNLPRAQALKDATMSHFILKGYEKGKLIIHFKSIGMHTEQS